MIQHQLLPVERVTVELREDAGQGFLQFRLGLKGDLVRQVSGRVVAQCTGEVLGYRRIPVHCPPVTLTQRASHVPEFCTHTHITPWHIMV